MTGAIVKLGFLHIGPPEHGVCRYGRLLAAEARRRSQLDVLEQDVVLTGSSQDVARLYQAAIALSQMQVVHIQFTELIWGADVLCYENLGQFFRACRSPIVVTIHDTEPPQSLLEMVGWRGRFRSGWQWGKATIRGWLTDLGMGDRASLNNAEIRRWLVSRSAASLVCTQEEGRRLKAVVPPTHGSRIQVIPHYIEPRQFHFSRQEARQELDLEGHRVVALIGFIYDGKGYRLLVEALPLLPADVLVVFAGGAAPGAEPFVEELLQRADALQVRDRLRITGYLPELEMEKYLLATDVPVCPYEVCYASSSLASWFSAGRAILTSDLPQFREYAVLAKGAVCTFFPYTPEALVEQIHVMLASLEVPHPAALQLKQQLAIEAVFDRHLQCYQMHSEQ
ncbi:MAG: glycosyltransferase [Leptolyngbyaceae cyanobacterium bins.59]|nr:glycosyltransferase [Leptolyngbyaceae cyanobacterium bins.59]